MSNIEPVLEAAQRLVDGEEGGLDGLRAALRRYDKEEREREAAEFREKYGTCPHERIEPPSMGDRRGGALVICGAPPVGVHNTFRMRQEPGTFRGPEVERVELQTVECAAGHYYVIRDGERVPVTRIMPDIVYVASPGFA